MTDPGSDPGRAELKQTVLRSATREVVIGHDRPFCIIGERINPTGRRIFQEQLRAGDLSAIERDVIVMVGGAPVTQEYADAVGADGYAADASQTVKRAKSLLEAKRTKVPA